MAKIGNTYHSKKYKVTLTLLHYIRDITYVVTQQIFVPLPGTPIPAELTLLLG